MSTFDRAIGVILKHEGGFVDDPSDPGGATNFGISLRWASKPPLRYTRKDIVNLTEKDAAMIYRVHWWGPGRYDEIKSQDVATKVFDMAINMGSSRALKIVQAALVDCDHAVDVDGIIGPKTIDAINECDPSTLLGKIIGRQSDFYRGLARSRPEMAKFLRGWLHRAAWPFSEMD